MAHFRRELLIGLVGTVVITSLVTAAAETWKQGPAPYLWGIAALGSVLLAWLIWGPKWQQWRSLKRGGALRIVGGEKTAAGRRIQYEDGTEDVDIQGKGAAHAALKNCAAGAWSIPPAPTRWEQIKRRFRRGLVGDHSKQSAPNH